MVGNRNNVNFSLALVNGAGACIVAVCLVSAAWLLVVRADHFSSEQIELAQRWETARQDLIQLRDAYDRQQSIVEQRRKELNERGKLPQAAPVEDYFQRLARFTTDYGLHIRAHRPHGSRTYPGLVEQRFAYEITGPVDNVIRFLAAVESTEFWCDISYFALEDGISNEPGQAAHPVASLTISMFHEPETKQG